MLHLANRELALAILDPTDPADLARQGWRYYKSEEAPRDLPKGAKPQKEPPPKMAAELRALGLL